MHSELEQSKIAASLDHLHISLQETRLDSCIAREAAMLVLCFSAFDAKPYSPPKYNFQFWIR